MSSTEKGIQHTGIVMDVQGGRMLVRIRNAAACGDCSSKALCALADLQDKIHTFKIREGEYVTGEKVIVTIKETVGGKILFYTYFLPFLLFLGFLSVLYYTFNNESFAAGIAFGSLIIYYIVFAFFRKKIKKKIDYTVIKDR
jgi:positive regulator of sigma E activity